MVLFARIALRNHLLHCLITDLSEPQPHFQVLLQLTGVKLGFNTAVVLLKQLQRFGGNTLTFWLKHDNHAAAVAGVSLSADKSTLFQLVKSIGDGGAGDKCEICHGRGLCPLGMGKKIPEQGEHIICYIQRLEYKGVSGFFIEKALFVGFLGGEKIIELADRIETLEDMREFAGLLTL